MDVLIKNARVVAPKNNYHGQQVDVFIKDGYIRAIGEQLEGEPSAEVLEAEDLCLSVGWLDWGVQAGDPGLEQRETLHTAGAAAAAGGFTAVVTLPNTEPVIDNKSQVLYIRRNAEGKLVNFHPMGSVTHACAGKEITEMIDMERSGAIAFTDGIHPIQHSGIMLRALQYVKSFGGLVVNQALDGQIDRGGQLHEGTVSTQLGMRGIPSLAEDLMVQRDLQLLDYTESRLHLSNISTKGAVEQIRQAKTAGLNVSCSVAVMNLIHDDQSLDSFDSHYKVMPPLRSPGDRAALIEGVQDGTIDVIDSNHRPLEEEAKKLEFSYADFGATGLETLYGLCRTFLSDWLTDELLIEKIAYQPRRLLGLEIPAIAVGAMAELTLFSPSQQWTYDRAQVYSRAFNSPYIGKLLQGKAIAVINNNQSFVNGHS